MFHRTSLVTLATLLHLSLAALACGPAPADAEETSASLGTVEDEDDVAAPPTTDDDDDAFAEAAPRGSGATWLVGRYTWEDRDDQTVARDEIVLAPDGSGRRVSQISHAGLPHVEELTRRDVGVRWSAGDASIVLDGVVLSVTPFAGCRLVKIGARVYERDGVGCPLSPPGAPRPDRGAAHGPW